MSGAFFPRCPSTVRPCGKVQNGENHRFFCCASRFGRPVVVLSVLQRLTRARLGSPPPSLGGIKLKKTRDWASM
jgi:hypothetical protein